MRDSETGKAAAIDGDCFCGGGSTFSDQLDIMVRKMEHDPVEQRREQFIAVRPQTNRIETELAEQIFWPAR